VFNSRVARGKGGNKELHDGSGQGLAQPGIRSRRPRYRWLRKFIFRPQIEDCKCAVRWLRAMWRDYKIDPKRIGAVGSSAGRSSGDDVGSDGLGRTVSKARADSSDSIE